MIIGKYNYGIKFSILQIKQTSQAPPTIGIKMRHIKFWLYLLWVFSKINGYFNTFAGVANKINKLIYCNLEKLWQWLVWNCSWNIEPSDNWTISMQIAINLAADAGLLSEELKLHKNTSKRLMNKCTSISLSELYPTQCKN